MEWEVTPAAGAAEDPKRQLLAGVRILDSVLCLFGFEFRFEHEGRNSGGQFASGSYYRGDRRLELHFRGRLGMVKYWVGDRHLTHVEYMRSLRVYGKNRYPDFSDDALDSFRELAEDIAAFAQDFTSGSGDNFKSFADELEKNPAMFSGLSAT
jgi:hypothetical protein